MKCIRFRRINSDIWEIAFNQDHLNAKLDGEFAEVIIPSKNILIRIWRKFFPLKFIEADIIK